MSTRPFSSLDAIDGLSDRELATAIFLVVCGLAEKLTGQVPCLVTPHENTPPTFIHGGDARVVWLPTNETGASPTNESVQAPPPVHCAILPSDAHE